MSRRARKPPGMPDEDWNENGNAVEIADVVASSVTTRPVEWLWKGRIPKGKLTMFDGDPDLGKSVVTMDIAARVSAGRPFPDGAPCEAGNVVICNVEDGIDDTIVPRLKAHGADLDRVYIFSDVPDGKGGARLLDLPDDLPLLEALVLRRDAALLIIDPVLTMLGGDANKDQDARKALTPVRDMAERTGAAVTGVRHLNKSVGLKAIQRGGGNMGLIGVARAGAFFAEHPDDNRMRVMAPHKSNLAEKPPSLSYRVVSWAIDPEIGRVEWMGATNHDANSLAAGNLNPHEKSVLNDAVAFLRDELGDAPVMAKQVFKDARDAGIAEITLRRAKTALRVGSERVGTEGWAWRLPEDDHRPPPGGGTEHAESGHQDGGEHDHNPASDRDDHVDHVDHLRGFGAGASPDSPYFREHDHDDQGDHGDHGDRDEHDHDHLPHGNGTPRDTRSQTDLVWAAFEDKRQGPAKNLRLYRGGQTTLEILTNSVLQALGVEWARGLGPAERGEWERVVEAVAADVGAEN